jgi:hypothetical protein
VFRSKIEIAGWVVVLASVAIVGTRYFRRLPPPEAESRKLPVKPVGKGAWWFTGNPAPVGTGLDLTGVWQAEGFIDISKGVVPGQEMILTSLGKQRYQTVDHAKNPTGFCLPPGPVRILMMMVPVMIVQRPDVVLLLTEAQRTYRIIYTDGRSHDADIKDYPEWMGSSIGHWEGDTLVVDTVGIDERSWLDLSGHEHSDQLHLTERIRLADANTIEHVMTFEDPVFFEKPFSIRMPLKRQIGGRILDHNCTENEKDRQNLVPTLGDAGR